MALSFLVTVTDLSERATVRQSAAVYFSRVDSLAEPQAEEIEQTIPNARVIRLHALHYVFLSNEATVLQEMRAFIDAIR